MLAEVRRGDEQLAVTAAVLLRVLDTDALEALAARGVGLVHRENSLSRRRDVVRCCDLFLFWEKSGQVYCEYIGLFKIDMIETKENVSFTNDRKKTT